jgi:hypothetical protein
MMPTEAGDPETWVICVYGERLKPASCAEHSVILIGLGRGRKTRRLSLSDIAHRDVKRGLGSDLVVT